MEIRQYHKGSNYNSLSDHRKREGKQFPAKINIQQHQRKKGDEWIQIKRPPIRYPSTLNISSLFHNIFHECQLHRFYEVDELYYTEKFMIDQRFSFNLSM